MRTRYGKLKELLQTGAVFSATVLSGDYAGIKGFWKSDGTGLCCDLHHETFWEPVIAHTQMESAALPGVIPFEGSRIFIERLVQAPELVICGGGHISQELAELSDYMEYPYIILDDREEFCNRERFPNARDCLCGGFSEMLPHCECSGNAYYIIVTRGHKADLECLELVLQRPFGYVGMIGSRAKVAKTMTALTENGYNPKLLSQVHAPIGLPIGGETPKEIAVSIVAQLIQEKNGEHPASYLEPDMLQILTGGAEGVLATIIGKRGSAPRGMGSRMIVGETGIICGTIGGGLVEYEAEKHARQMLHEKTGQIVSETYRVNEDSAAALGMWCGGEVDVLFEHL